MYEIIAGRLPRFSPTIYKFPEIPETRPFWNLLPTLDNFPLFQYILKKNLR